MDGTAARREADKILAELPDRISDVRCRPVRPARSWSIAWPRSPVTRGYGRH